MFSAFKLGRFAGGGMRRAMATLPRLCKPWRGVTAGEWGEQGLEADSGVGTLGQSPFLTPAPLRMP